jgi:Holliday junction resolvase YEN1
LTVLRIYGEIGPGERVALSKLAIEKFEETGRPLRIAIDISIWQFQIQAGQGGSNPAIRTFYYRLLRLLSVSVQPLFVFDGSRKPPFKRNKRSGHHGASVPNLLCKQLINFFGFPFHMAPGEAEAECALLQREGIVDAVLSEDVDTLMFGSGLTLRNWSSEGRGNKSPTHVSAYYSMATKEGKSGLDREGMILVALMSGGDYITEGIPGCGIKAACEAARAGFGKSLCQLSRSDTAGLDAWRENLAHEIQTNESKFFRIKHRTLKIPDNFPSKEVLGYYTHPVVSSASKVRKLKDEIVWDGDIDIPGLRVFVAEAFDWTHRIGAKKLIRGLAPALLVHKLRLRGDRRASGYDDVVLTAMNEMEIVRAICGKRTHFSTDGVPELRVVYHPADIVGLDLDAEADDSEDYGRDGLAPLNEDDDIEAYESNPESRSRSASPSKRAACVYDPTQPDKLWILETIAKVGIPLKVEDYEESLRSPRKFLRAKATARRAATKNGMPKGAMDKFVSISKPGLEESTGNKSKAPTKTKDGSCQPILPPVYLAPSLENATFSISTTRSSESSRTTRQTRSARLTSVAAGNTAQKTIITSKTTATSKKKRKAAVEQPGTNKNPWTIALSSSPAQRPSVTKNLGQTFQKDSPPPRYKLPEKPAPDRALNSSSPSSPPPHSAPLSRKHAQSPQPESQSEREEDSFVNITMSGGVEQADHHLSTATISEIGRNRPSPRKKRSPIAPSTTPSPGLPPHSEPGNLTPEPVHRKIDLFSVSRARSSSPKLPSFQELGLPRNQTKAMPSPERTISLLSSSPEATRTQAGEGAYGVAVHENNIPKGANGKKYILLRESLPGAWKEADVSELVHGKSRAWRYSQVECLDLSAE